MTDNRKPCAAWEVFRAAEGRGYRLLRAEVVATRNCYTVHGVPSMIDPFFGSVIDAQLAAEDALEADAREVLRVLGKDGV